MLPGFEDIEGMTKRAISKIEEFRGRLKLSPKSKPVKSRRIEKALGLKGTEVRAIVSYLRCKGNPIGSTSKGYFWARTRSELSSTQGQIHGRIVQLTKVRAGLEIAYENLAA